MEQRYATRSSACGVRFPVKGRWAVCLLAAAAALSCQKAGTQLSGGKIVLCVEDGGVQASVDTKATPVTAIPSTLYWGATTGSGAESVKWAAASATVSSGKISTGKYQTATPTAYNYYVANRTFTAGGTMSVPNNSIDIVAGRTASSTLSFPSVTLNHIFARTGALTLNVPAGYTATSVSWRIKSKGAISGTAGTYDMKSQSWTAASTALSDQAFTGSSDLWVIPGTYTVTVSFTLTKGAFTKAYTQAGDVTLVAGKQNNITATTNNDEAAQVSFGVSLSAWSNNQTDLTAADFHTAP